MKSGVSKKDAMLARRKAERVWRRLCDKYLPLRPKRSIWSFSRRRNQRDLAQGWKLHVSATVLSACAIFRLVAPYLSRRNIALKAVRSLSELAKLNEGTYGFSQIGKFITIYPPNTKIAVAIADDFATLTAGQPAPVVSFDNVVRENSCVYYRYGVFFDSRRVVFRRKRVSAIARPDGRLVPDRRAPGAAVPRWLNDPFIAIQDQRRESLTPLETRYGNYEALMQRGRGGVYRASDLSLKRPRICIIKEGRRHGEASWGGGDGLRQIQQEAHFLKSVSKRIHVVPRVYDTFVADGSFHLVMEYIAGRSLHNLIIGRQRISTKRLLTLCLNMARIVAGIHAAGWAWRDCKPDNFLCQKNGKLRAVDFEGACKVGDSNPSLWGTPLYAPPKWKGDSDSRAADSYALGVSFMQLVTRKVVRPSKFTAFERKAKKLRLPPAFVEVTGRLAAVDPVDRLNASAAQRILQNLVGGSRGANRQATVQVGVRLRKS
jgi:hypothetical protein